MHYSDELRVIWFTPERNGTRSTIYLIKSLGFKIGSHEMVYPENKKDYSFICNIRNPYSRLVSLYFLESNQINDFERDFSRWVQNSIVNSGFILGFQLYYHRKLPVNTKFIRVENFIQDIKNLEFINFNNFEIKKVFKENIEYNHYKDEFNSKKERKSWNHYYNQQLADFVYGKLEEQFLYFGYDKNSWINGTP